MGRSNMILKTWRLSKKVKKDLLLDNISINLSEGKITGIIGTENSGKTTLLQILGGRQKPDQGDIEILGKPVNRKSFLSVSYLAEGDILPGFYTGKNLIHFFKNYYPDFSIEKSNSYAETLKINLTKNINKLSRQTKELLKTILCLSRNTSLFLLDNPFMMLDAFHLDLLVTSIYSSIQQNNAIILTARDPSILELVCDDFLILSRGKTIFYGDGEDFRLHRNQSMSTFYKKALSK
jgi:ABC-2 type transport system ATP-binding protein